MSYDAAGNELKTPAGVPSNGAAAATYSPRNQLASQFVRQYDRCVEEMGSACIQPDPVQEWHSNVYDGRGVRVLSTRNIVSLGDTIGIEEPQPDLYFYTPELSMLNIVAPSTGRTADVIWFGSRPVADHGDDGLRYTFTDHLGTPVLQTTPAAGVAWRVAYEPFGGVHALRAGSQADDQPLRFPGQVVTYRTPAGDESYNIFRWYRSGWGRYTQADPILGRDPDANDVYGYSKQNPILYTDPEGLLAQAVCQKVATGGGFSTGFYHCRIRVTCKECPGGNFGGPFDTTVGLERNRKTGDLEINEWKSYSGVTYDLGISEADSCNFGRCVRSNAAYFQKFAKGWNDQYRITGPNSNTFIGHLARSCGSKEQPYWAPGWFEPPFFSY